MCGIAGYADASGGRPEVSAVARMADLLEHRGPDGEGTEVVSSEASASCVVFGHRRLAILDLSDAGLQPLRNEDGSVLVVYNGEIYNFAELRKDLEDRGHRFRSRADTEVLVHAYEAYGEDFVSRLTGMFAFALWDDKRQRLLLARDRAGKKPLYYSWDGRRLTFASETKALRSCSWIDGSVDWERVPELLSFGYVAWPRTLHGAIRQVPPASIMVLEGGTLSDPKPYWRLELGADHEAVSWDEAEEIVLAELRGAVRRRLESDVPLGVLLSGGLDSSAVVALMAESGHEVRSFSAGMEDDSTFDERRYARAVAERFGTRHTEITIGGDAGSLLDRVVWCLDQPLADSSAVPTYLISQAARRYVTVLLTGDGGDEVFGGYERFAAALLAQRIPNRAQRLLASAAPLLPQSDGYYSLGRRLARFSKEAGEDPIARYRSWMAIFDAAALRRVVKPELSLSRSTASFDDAAAEADGELLNELLYINFRTYLHDDLLVKTDRMTMANSLEARSPFLDSDLIAAVSSLPTAMKATPFALKRILRRSMRGLLPKEIVRRRKHGFGVPVGRWFRSELREPYCDLVLDRGARSATAVRLDEADRIMKEHLEGKVDHGARLWALLVLEVWLRSLEARHGSSEARLSAAP